MSGEGHSQDFERYRQGLAYYAKNYKNRIYLLYQAVLDAAHHDDFTSEELEELVRIAFPGWEGDGNG